MQEAKVPIWGQTEVDKLRRMVIALELTVEELIMSTGDMQSAEQQLAADEQTLETGEQNLKSVVTTAIADLQAQLASLKASGGDPTLINQIDGRIQQLAADIGAESTTVQGQDPGQPTPPAPTPAPAPTPPAPPAGS